MNDNVMMLWMGLVLTGALLMLMYMAVFYIKLAIGRRELMIRFASLRRVLKKRDGEIPELVVEIQGLLKSEQYLLIELAKARHLLSEVMHHPVQASKLIEAEIHLRRKLEHLRKAVGEHLEAHAEPSVDSLFNRIVLWERILADKCQAYNASVAYYNDGVSHPVGMWVARMGRFQPYQPISFERGGVYRRNGDAAFQGYASEMQDI